MGSLVGTEMWCFGLGIEFDFVVFAISGMNVGIELRYLVSNRVSDVAIRSSEMSATFDMN